MTATTNHAPTIAQLKELATDLPSAMRKTVEHMIDRCMESEVSEQIGAEHQQRSTERETHRNGYRQRSPPGRAGSSRARRRR